MELMLLAGIIGFIAGGIAMFFMKDKLQIDNVMHSKIDQLLGKADSNTQALASHVNSQLANISGQIAQIDDKIASKA